MSISFRMVRLGAVLLTLLPMIQEIHADWASVTALDAPVPISQDGAKAKETMRVKLTAQIDANERFLRQSPDDSHAMESRIRLASAQGRLASLQADKAGVHKAVLKLKELEKSIPDRSLRAEAMFRRITLEWQDMGDGPQQKRENAMALSGQFFQEYPQDRRAARLLAEAAALCNYHPIDKKRLIDQALSVCGEEALRQRLMDDKLQLQQLYRPVDLRFTATDGSKVDLAEERGKVTAVVFWSAESAPSLVWMGYFAKYAESFPSLRVVTVSLDRNKSDLDAAMKSLHLLWPTAFDGQGWQNAIARRFGINTLPTLWLLDRKGNLAFLNARDNYQLKVNELLLSK
jgi:Thioredoxin-like